MGNPHGGSHWRIQSQASESASADSVNWLISLSRWYVVEISNKVPKAQEDRMKHLKLESIVWKGEENVL